MNAALATVIVKGVKQSSGVILKGLDEQLPEDVRQSAITCAQSSDLDAHCARLLSACGTWNKHE